MPNKRVSIDSDHVPLDSGRLKQSRGPAPAPWPIPDFQPLKINNPLTHGRGVLPLGVETSDAFGIFSLCFSDNLLEIPAENTNENAYLYGLRDTTPHARKWIDTTATELRAYIATYIWMGLHYESRITSYWNQDEARGPLHHAVIRHISRDRWEQIDRFFHVSCPPRPGPFTKTTYERLEPLNDHLRDAFKKYWQPGTHLAVDETIQPFMGRSSDTVNIPTKPETEGFKVWLLANGGYVMDWMYHLKGNAGPVDLDEYFTKKLGFSKTQAVVLDLLNQAVISDKLNHII